MVQATIEAQRQNAQEGHQRNSEESVAQPTLTEVLVVGVILEYPFYGVAHDDEEGHTTHELEDRAVIGAVM